MSMSRQTILASRPAAMVLALTLVAGLTAPFVLLPRAHAQAAATPLPCTVGNQNGCTELSPTPPQDTVAVPPNIVLMLDDSGSMAWDYMPDWGYINTTNNALINSNNNGTYYNPTVPYLPPPHADGTLFTNYTDITNVPADGFNPGSGRDLTNYSGGNYSYSASRGVTTTSPATFDGTVSYTRSGKKNNYVYTYADQVCRNNFNAATGASNYSFTGATQDSNGNWLTGECKYTYTTTSTKTYRYFQYSTGPANGPYVIHYVAPASQGCGDLSATTTPDCVLDTSSTGLKDANNNDISMGQNIANWFAYDHTRILLAKTGLMTAFNNLNPAYRFGFASINANNLNGIPGTPTPFTFDDYTPGGGNTNNLLAVVQPFGAALDANGNPNTNSQRYKFWAWIQNESANGNTPLRKALGGAGQYYQTTQPWNTMSSDPGYTAGSTTQFACRASYTILTTDGFWNGQSPGGIGYAAGTNGPSQSVPAAVPPNATQYLAVPPFSGGGAGGTTPSLADVATYYWENDLSSMPNEVAPNAQDPATWQHMTTFTMGLGFTPTNISPGGTTIPQIFAWAQGGGAIANFSWPTPSSNNINNIADLAHAAVNGHGDFFSVKSPQELAAGFSKALADINGRTVLPTPSAVNASVLTAGALTFETGYNTGNWTGSFKVVELNSDGSAGASVWPTDPDTLLNTDFHGAGYSGRKVYTASYQSTDPAGKVTGFQFNAAALTATAPNTFDTKEYDPATQTGWLASPALGGGDDTVANRINYLLGDDEYEGVATGFRTRGSILGTIINASPVYVDGAESNYNGNWPTGSVELATGAQAYEDFRTQQASVPGMVYVAANDGMLHAFNAPAPVCNSFATDGSGCTSWDYGANPGKEAWAFIPRAVYANLGNLTSATDFNYRPTVDSTPVSRDVYFGESGASNTDSKWHTILTGGVGLGGRGVYALDITNGGASQPKVLWELDSDMTIPASSNCKVVGPSTDAGICAASDLGFTAAQPNVGRLPDGTWAVIMPNGYFPDCTTSDYPTGDINSCQAAAAQAPKYSNGHPYSALFVLDAQTGTVIAEMKTPDIAGVTSFGLATPVMGNLSNNNVDSVAYAGDVEGNLWKFTFGGTDPTDWTVSLVYQAATQGAQPITSMPRLFPDPITNGFMVVFGTGKFLGVGDNSNSTVQSIYGVRDGDPSDATPASKVVILGGSGVNGLTQNYLHETVVTAPATVPNPNPPPATIPNPQLGETLRCITGGSSDTCDAPGVGVTNPATAVADSSKSGGWYVNLDVEVAGKQTNAGERVVVNPGAIFASNTVVFESLITGAASSDPCSPTTTGAVMALNAVTGGPAGVSSLGGWPIIGGRINNARTSGSLPIVSALGGGQAYLPGTGLAPSGKTPFSLDAPIWRRRSWSEINPNQ